jgi:hypothetical protein
MRNEGISPLKQQSKSNSSFSEILPRTSEAERETVKLKKERDPAITPPIHYDPYIEIDLMTFPPVYSKLLTEGCTEDVAEQFLGLVQDGLLGSVEWNSEHGENLLKNISRKSRRKGGVKLKEFFDEFRSMKMDPSSDKLHRFKKMCQSL